MSGLHMPRDDKPRIDENDILIILLLTALLLLKLSGVVTWPWVWVLFPFWAPAVFALGGSVLLLLCYCALRLWGAILRAIRGDQNGNKS